MSVGALLLVACQGRTTGASNFNASNNTIKLSGVGSCDTQCTAYIRYRQLGTSTWTNTPTFSVGSKVTNVPFSQTVTVAPGVKYEYQVCGKESSQSQYFCAGPDGTAGTTEVFTAGPLQARTGAATNVYDTSATITGELQSTLSGQVTVWFQYGKTTAYGTYGTNNPYNKTLSANTSYTVSTSINTMPGTTYHYRLCAVNKPNASTSDPGAVCGGDRTLQTTKGVTVTCGQTITTSTVLGNDLANCPGEGLIIGAPNITLDLNGHSISGNVAKYPTYCPDTGYPPHGVVNGYASIGYAGVSIINGSISGFETGVYLSGSADDNTLRNLNVSSNSCEGIVSNYADRTHVSNNSLGDNHGREIGVDNGVGNVIENNSVGGALYGYTDHAGIQLSGGSSNRVEGNTVSGSLDFGIEIINNSTDNQVVSNTVTGPNYDGIVIALGSNTNVVDRNTVSNMTSSDPDPADPGVYGAIEVVQTSSGNRITNNTLHDNTPPNIVIGMPHSGSFGPSNANTVSGNTSSTSTSDGIIVGTTATNTVISQNTTSNNRDDGIHVDVASTTITSNTANNNADLGIEAVAGVTNGGGNHASGNGNPVAQCTNITCSP